MYIIFNIETTGLPKNSLAPITDLDNWPRLIRLSYIVYDFSFEILKEKNVLIYPDNFEIPNNSYKWHGITNDLAIKKGFNIKEILVEFNEDVKRAYYVISHNLDFNENILLSEYYRLNLDSYLLNKEKICTMKSSINLCKIKGDNNYKWPKLEELYSFLFNKNFDNINKTIVTAKCFIKLKSLDIIKLKNEKNKRLVKENYQNKTKTNLINKSSENYETLLSFFKRIIDEENEEIVLDFFMKQYPFDFETIKSNKKILDFEKLSMNRNVDWTEELIIHYKEKWNWNLLSEHIYLDYNLISKFENELQIESNITYYNLNYPEVFISEGISNNPNVQWDTLILDTYKDSLCWRDICKNKNIEWDEFLIDRYLNYIDWSELCQNEYVKWDENCIKKYYDYIDWKSLSKNKCLESSIILEKYKDKLNWKNVSANNNIKWNLFLVLKYKEKIDWEIFSMYNKYCHIVYQSEYKNLILNDNKNWNRIFFNKNFPWNTNLLKEVEILIDDKIKRYISSNIQIKWTSEFIDENLNIIDWNELSKNTSVIWTPEFINKYKFYWNYDNLANNKNVNWFEWEFDLKFLFITHSNFTNIRWNIELFNKFNYYVKLDKNKTLTSFLKNYLNNELFEEIKKLIIDKKIIETFFIGISKKNMIYKFENILDFNKFNFSLLKNNDDIIVDKFYLNNSNILLVFTKNGNYFKIEVDSIKKNVIDYNKLISLNNLMDLNSENEIISIFDVNSFEVEDDIVILTKNQNIHLIPIKNFLNNISLNKILNDDTIYDIKKINKKSNVYISSETGYIFKYIISSQRKYCVKNQRGILFNKIFSINNKFSDLILIDSNNYFYYFKTEEIELFNNNSLKKTDKLINLDYKESYLLEILPLKNNFDFEIFPALFYTSIIIDLKSIFKNLFLKKIHHEDTINKIVKIKN